MRPRDAASLILYRESQRGYELLMGRRSKQARFMPGVYVFPGGAVDAGDARVQPASELPDHLPALLKVGRSARRATAMAITAIRETYEETGLMVGAAGDPGHSGDPLWSAWRRRQRAPHLACLDLMARAITPPDRPIRFHARFFLAQAHHASGEIRGDGELEDIDWVLLEDAKKLPLANIQGFLVEHLAQVLSNGSMHDLRPLFSFRYGKRRIRWE